MLGGTSLTAPAEAAPPRTLLMAATRCEDRLRRIAPFGSRRRVFPALVVVAIAVTTGERIAGAAVGGTVPHPPDHTDCKQMASTGRAVARRCADGRTEAHVDNRINVHLAPYPPRFRHRPIDRLRSRGEGKIRAAGDKGARRELRRKARRRH
jgi:hypothetical protein